MPHLSIKKYLVMACHLTGVYDVNRNTTLQDDNYALIHDWADSIIRLGLQGIIFHNNFSPETCEKYQNENISFIKIDYNIQYNPNVYRYLVYRDFLKTYSQNIEGVFVTDVSDVVVLKNPFEQDLFIKNPSYIFCGDEPKVLDNEWMNSHSTHLRNKITDFSEYEQEFKNAPLLNCGIIGGNIKIMQEFIEQLAEIHQRYNKDNQTVFTGDMGAFNYLARTQYNKKLFHGSPVNTQFKAFELQETACWFRHK
jgi:hypothetical protein